MTTTEGTAIRCAREPRLAAPPREGADLAPLALRPLPLGAVRPRGWLRHQLESMVDGMVGHLEELSPHLAPDNGWFRDGAEGWEEQPYWLRGLYPLAVMTGDERCRATAERWIEAVLAGQAADGWFGSSYHRNRVGQDGRRICDLWGHMVMLWPLRDHYECRGDERVLDLMERFFAYVAAIPEEQFIQQVRGDAWQEYREDFGDWKVGVQMKRAGDMIHHLHWLFERTGDTALLSLATRFFQAVLPPVSEFLDVHVVNFAQRFAYAALYGRQADPVRGLTESEYWYRQHLAVWGQQPRGAYGADEMIRSGRTDPRQGMETCAMIELALKCYELGRISGDPLYADRVEDLLLNHFPASQTADLKALHYLTASNCPQCDGGGGHDFWNEERARERGDSNPMLSFSPHRYRCCQHNVAMGWPYHARNLWQASADGGLVAWLYAASEVATTIGGERIHLIQDTGYPFDGSVRIRVAAGTARFPLHLRLPGWSAGYRLELAGETLDAGGPGGGVLRVEREWGPGDELALHLEQRVTVERWPRSGALTVERGPLSYSVRIEEDWRRCGGSDDWPEWEVLPTTPWNYGLALDDAGGIEAEVVDRPAGDQPWSLEGAPLELRVPAHRIPDWRLEPGGSPQELRRSPIRSGTPRERLRMVPMGCARLRMTCLPEVADDQPHASAWKPYKDT